MKNTYKLISTILLVDDDPTNLRFLQDILKENFKVYAAPSGERALSFLEKKIPDLILLDIEMPKMNGYEVIKTLKDNNKWNEIPVIFLTAQEGREKEQEAFDLGAVDYILKPISAGIVNARVKLHIDLKNYEKNLEALVDVRTNQLNMTQDALLNILANMTSYRDNETGAHIKRTTIFSELLIKNLMEINHPDYLIDEEYAENIIKSAKLHDIGKVAVPDHILFKPGKLTAEEFEQIKQHTIYGAQILDSAIKELGDYSYFLNITREIIIAHHEKWNGSGYPYGLEGTDIPLPARIMAIADVYDALISNRPYKRGFTHEASMKIIMHDSGTHFDPTLIELSKPVFDHFQEIAAKYKDEHFGFYTTKS